jgi:tRNA G46 methylase TrmB
MTQQSARPVDSDQREPHPRLRDRVERHLHHPFRKPIAAHNRAAFDAVAEQVAAHAGPLLLDSFCGIGESTAALAAQYPAALVIGIDKSKHRLDKHRAGDGGSYRLVRAETEDFWRLAVAAGWRPQRHTLFYPNPWPKKEHLQRRVHGSPLLPTLLALGGELELRSNWPVYVEEFALALELAGWRAQLEPVPPLAPISGFERKYRQAGQTLWRCLGTAL